MKKLLIVSAWLEAATGVALMVSPAPPIYRWLFTDYSQGSGTSQFRYNILTQGPQVGFTVHF
jgi:hypothetical protein